MKNSTQPVKDPYNRQIDYLRISVTDKCNLRCVYCMPDRRPRPFKKGDILTYEEIIRFVRVAYNNGLRKVRITGGEPLLRKNITGLISALKKIGIRDLSLTTNGIILSGLAEKLKDAGLDRINISLDTLDAGRYRSITKGGDIHSVLESIHEAERVGLMPVKINVVPIRGMNDDEILSFASLTFDKNFHVRFIEFMPASCSGMWKEDRCVKSSEIMERISGLGVLKSCKFKGRGPSRNYKFRGAAGVIGIISPISDHFCSLCNRLRLTADGKIRPCLFSPEEVDIKTPMRRGATEEDMDNLYHHAVKIKPQRHFINDNAESGKHLRAMSKIGG